MSFYQKIMENKLVLGENKLKVVINLFLQFCVVKLYVNSRKIRNLQKLNYVFFDRLEKSDNKEI